MRIFIGIIVFIFGLGIVICLHEAGHFSMAKLFKVYCEEFSIGFGPRIISINPKDKKTGQKKWETTLNIRLLPLGGYVSMVGEEEDSQMTEAGQTPVPKERTFGGVNHGKQAIIMIAGIVMNVILSYFLFLFGNAFGRQQDPYVDRIALVDNSPLAERGLSSGDIIDGLVLELGTLDIDSDGNRSASSTLMIVDGDGNELTPQQYVSFKDKYSGIKYNQLIRKIGSYPEVETEFKFDTYNFYRLQSITDIAVFDDHGANLVVQVDSVVASSDSTDADKLLRYAPVGKDGGLKLTVDYTRRSDGQKGETIQAQIPNKEAERLLDDHQTLQKYYSFGSLGVGVYMTYMPDLAAQKAGSDRITGDTFGRAIVRSFVNQGEGIRDVYVALGSLFTPKGWNNVGGIVSIFMTNQQAVDLGFYYVMWVWGIISINLAVLNLLPIPGLDGWQLLLCIIESITRKKISQKFKGYASIIGLSCLIILSVVLIILDLIRYLG